MIGNRLLRYLKPVPPRYLAKLDLFTEYLKYKVEDATLRASYLTPNGNGARLFSEILRRADVPNLLNGDPSLRTPTMLQSLSRDLDKFIDVRTGKHTTTTLFIKSRTPCYELITPSKRTTPLTDIPFDAPYSDDRWKAIKPFRIHDMGAADLRFAIHSDYLVYPNHSPTHAIYSLDCLVLLAKFMAYYKTVPAGTELNQAIASFVHKEVIIPTMLNDSLALWLRNIYKQQLISGSVLESFTSTMWDSIDIDTLGSNFNGAMIDIQKLKQELSNQSITAQTALSSFLLTFDKASFTHYYKELITTATVPNEQPYFWVDCIKNLAWWEFIVLITSFVPSHPESISLQRDILRDLRLALMEKPWFSIHGSIPLKIMIRSRIEGLYAYLQNKG